jgi:HD domain
MKEQATSTEILETLKQPVTLEQLRLLTMPLSGVTSRYGVDGLLKRYIAQTKDLEPNTTDTCNRAIVLAHSLFKEDTYKGEPYLTHLLRVALRLHRDFDVTDPDLLCAAVLHDSIEDHPEELTALTGDTSPYAAVEQLFNARVAGLVQALSNDAKPSGMTDADKRTHYAAGIRKKLAMEFDVFLIKCSDFIDNGVGLHWGDDDKKLQKLALKYYPIFDVFIEFAAKYLESGELTRSQYLMIVRKMSKGKKSCAAYMTALES